MANCQSTSESEEESPSDSGVEDPKDELEESSSVSDGQERGAVPPIRAMMPLRWAVSKVRSSIPDVPIKEHNVREEEAS